MELDLRYTLKQHLHPWDTEQREAGIYAYVIVSQIFNGNKIISENPIAIFNLDTDAVLFVDYLRGGGKLLVEGIDV
jgi:hypothetical protein